MNTSKILKTLMSLAIVLSCLLLSSCTSSKSRQAELKSEALVTLNKGEYDKAVELLSEALKYSEGRVTSDEVDISLYKAAAQINTSDIKGAIKTYTALIDYDEDNSEFYFLRGSVYLKAGEKASCIEDYKKAIDIDEDNYDMYMAMYNNLAAVGYEKEGEEFLNIALETSGDSAEDCLYRGRIYMLMEQYDAAKSAFLKADDKGLEDANIYLADMYLAQGNESECDKILESYEQKSNISSLACNKVANMEIKRGNAKTALTYINEGLDKLIVDNKRDLLKSRVAAYECMGSFEEAFTYATEFLLEYPNDVDMMREVKFLSTRV